MMDIDLDHSFAPSETIYGARAVRLDPVTQGGCYLGTANARCIGITPQQSEYAPGLAGTSGPPFVLAQTGDNSKVPVYGIGRCCLWDYDPAAGSAVAPNDLLISGAAGVAVKAATTGTTVQWVLGIALSHAVAGQSINVKVVLFPWRPALA